MTDISFVMPCYKDANTLEIAVNSLLDQDWKNLEVIIVNDGSPDNANEVIDKLEAKDPRVKSVRFETNQGACNARNAGAKIATGRYLSFLPADALLYPGNVRVWVETLDAQPNFAFLYGGYRFVKALDPNGGESLNDYLSEPFDPYLLDVTNYIDGSFPLRREWFDKIGGWDPTVKSLQDWDFWLRVVKAGGKGFYFRDVFFETEMPHQGGLSFDSASNWIDRTNYIKQKNGIPLRKVCVASLGAGWHAKNIAKMLDADFKEMPSFKPHEYEAIYVIGFYPQFADMQGEMFGNIYGNLNAGITAAKKIVHFVGTDIYQMQSLPQLQLQFYREYFKHNIDVILCEDEFTQKELKALGFDADIVPIPPAKLYKTMPLPKEFSVAVYMPQVNKDFYRPQLMVEVARSMPDIKFKFFGDQYERRVEGNIEWLGHQSEAEMGELIKNTSCLLRMPIHDGLSLNALEFITAGRQVVSSTPVKHAIHVDRPEPHLIRIALEKARIAGINKGAAYWRKLLDHKTFAKTMNKYFEYDPKGYWERRAESWDRQAGDVLPDLHLLEPLMAELDPKTVLDVGCGSGRWYPYFKAKGIDYRGVDISSNLIKLAQQKYPDGMFKTSKVEDIPKPPTKFDLAFLYTCLEHVTEPEMQKAADALNRCAKKLILVEPVNFKTRHYCHDHNYYNYFNIVKEIPAGDKMIYVVET